MSASSFTPHASSSRSLPPERCTAAARARSGQVAAGELGDREQRLPRFLGPVVEHRGTAVVPASSRASASCAQEASSCAIGSANSTASRRRNRRHRLVRPLTRQPDWDRPVSDRVRQLPIPVSAFATEDAEVDELLCAGRRSGGRGCRAGCRRSGVPVAARCSVVALKIASVSSSISVGAAVSILRNSTASVGMIVRHGRATSNSSTSRSRDLPHRFSGLVTARKGVVSNASSAWVCATQRASASACATVRTR